MSQRMETPADVDLTDLAIQQCPYPAYSVLREQAPVRLRRSPSDSRASRGKGWVGETHARGS